MAGLTRVAPELPVADLPMALEYYTKRLGFEVAVVMPDGDYAIVERDGVALHLFRADTATVSPAAIHVFSIGLDELFVELQGLGARIVQAIETKPWGNREFRVMDSGGNTIKFTEPAV